MSMKTYKEWKATVRDAAEKAASKYDTPADFARAVGLTRNELNAFLKNQHLGKPKVYLLERWLVDNGHLATTPRAQEVPSPYGQEIDLPWIVGQEMISMALWLQSPELSMKEKIARYKVWLNQASENLKKLVALQEKRGE